jgi:acetylornithine deacetylase/succinyl-diaminopimelate desuccinylase-like protein
MLVGQMQGLDFDKVSTDKFGNVIGLLKGYESKNTLVIISHMDIPNNDAAKKEQFYGSNIIKYKSGIASAIFSAGLLKRTLIPFNSDLVICCIPRIETGDYSVRYLFENFLKSRLKKIKGVILCEPTDFNLNLGHKGRMEYEIVVRGNLNSSFFERKGINMLGAMFPLIHELETVSKNLPKDYALGSSSLRIKDMRYSGYKSFENVNEFSIIVDRVFIPEENEQYILNKAKAIATDIYKEEGNVNISTALAKEKIKTYTGLEIVSEKEFKPWLMEANNPFVLSCLGALRECGFNSSTGYWKNIVTEGSYTCGELHIPTIGFGAGREEDINPKSETLSIESIEKAIYGLSSIVGRSIGLPAFGWSSDEI